MIAVQRFPRGPLRPAELGTVLVRSNRGKTVLPRFEPGQKKIFFLFFESLALRGVC